jgi:hypothetical protein
MRKLLPLAVSAVTVAVLTSTSVPPVAAAEPAAAAAETTSTTVITPNPWYEHAPFTGWGTSLAWFANAAGRYALSDDPDARKLADDFYDLLFSDAGLDLQTVRYNIGGGNASDTADYLRPGAAVEGWWAHDPTGEAGLYGGSPTSYDARGELLNRWNPDDDADYDFTADASQRWWLSKLQADQQVKNWEFFSNSAPYFLTNSGYVSGHWRGSSDDQLAGDGTETGSTTNATEKFAKYIARVTKYLSDEYGITPDTVEPLNEPNDCPNCWATDGTTDSPKARQEGMSVKPDQQARLIRDLREALDSHGLTTREGKNRVAAMDASSSQTFSSDYLGSDNGGNGYKQNVDIWRDPLGQINTHGYGDQSRAAWIRDIAKSFDKPLMQSEFEGDYSGTGYDPYDFTNAINFADRMNYQMAQYEPNSWVLWQPVEDYYNMEQPPSTGGENLNWGSIFIDFDCRTFARADGSTVFASERRVDRLYGGVDANGHVRADVPACALATNSKFNMLKNYTHFIQAGDSVIATDSSDATAAIRPTDKSLRVVYTNSDSANTTVKLDLRGFGDIARGATVQKYVTTRAPSDGSTTANTLVHDSAQDVAVDAGSRSATVEVPARSVTTFVVTGVSGVSADAPSALDAHAYQLVGQGSGKPIAARAAGSAVALDSTAAAPAQKWTFTAVAAASTRPTDRAYVLSSNDGAVLVGDSSGVRTTSELSVARAKSDPSAIWILNTTDGTHFSLVNKAGVQALEVPGGATTDGTALALWDSNNGTNQAWTLRDLAVSSATALTAATPIGRAPTLPATATPAYRWGSGQAAPVSWRLPDASVWDAPGTVVVTGFATDAYGTAFDVTSTVEVGEFTITDPASVTVPVGSSLQHLVVQAPSVVDARMGASAIVHPTAVTWDWSSVDANTLTQTGVVRVTGAAKPLSGVTSIPATLNLIVVTATDANIARLPATRVGASFTEKAQYTAENTRDGDRGTVWSNWKPEAGADRDPWLSYTFDRPYTLTSLDFFVGTGSNGAAESPVAGIAVQYLSTDGKWTNSGVSTTQIQTAPGTPTTLDLSRLPQTTGVRLSMTYSAGGYFTKVGEVEILGKIADSADTATLAALRLGGTAIDGFSPDTADYRVAKPAGGLPSVVAIPTDRDATAAITPPTSASPVAKIVVTAANARASRTYTVTFVDALAPVNVQTTVTPRCVAGKVTLYVASKNADTATATVGWTTAYGSKSGVGIQPTKSGSASFTTRKASIPAGTVTVAATADGRIPLNAAVPFPATTCAN